MQSVAFASAHVEPYTVDVDHAPETRSESSTLAVLRIDHPGVHGMNSDPMAVYGCTVLSSLPTSMDTLPFAKPVDGSTLAPVAASYRQVSPPRLRATGNNGRHPARDTGERT